jgi:hypothetical protein
MSVKKLSLKKNDKHALWLALHEYSYAEYSSAIEMIQAAKRCGDVKIARDYIRHSLDEYRHAHLMRSLISEYTNGSTDCYRDVRFCSNHVLKKGYIDPSKFLFQKYDFQRFSIFVGINEQHACAFFKKLEIQCARKLKAYDGEAGDRGVYRRHVRLALETIRQLVADEHEHEKYALGNGRRNFKNSKFLRILFWEKITNRVRHFYASNTRFNAWIASFVYFLVIILITPFRFVFCVRSSEMDNLISKDKSELML